MFTSVFICTTLSTSYKGTKMLLLLDIGGSYVSASLTVRSTLKWHQTSDQLLILV